MQASVKNDVRTAWSDAWDHGDFAAMSRLVAPDYARRNASSGRVSDFAAFAAGVREVRSAFPDLETRIDRILVDGDTLAVFWTSEGTFLQPLGTVPPTGRRVITHGCNSSTLRDGRIIEEVVTWDSEELLRDLGVPSLTSAFEAAEQAASDLSGGLAPRDMLKAFNKQFVSGVTVVTTREEDGTPRGLAVSSYTSVSLDPPLVLVCVQTSSSTHPVLFRAGHFGINILSSEQSDVLSVFASKEPDKFATLAWHEGPAGSPLIDASSASMEVEIKERFQALTHTVLIGRVLHAETTDVAPVVYRAGAFYDGRELVAL